MNKSKNYSNKVFKSLKENKTLKLSVLLKEEDAFDKEDKEQEEDQESQEGEELEASEEDELNTDESDLDSEAEAETVSVEAFNELSDSISKIESLITNTLNNKGLRSIEANIGSAVVKDVDMHVDSKKDDVPIKTEESFKRSAGYYKKNSISKYLFEESEVSDEELEAAEIDIDRLDKILTKGTDLVNRFQKGSDIDVESYVDAAINAYRNFDSLFAKEDIIKQGAINVIVLNSGAKAESNIMEFEELFHEQLSKQFNIDYDEYALTTKKNKSAAGAKSQG